MRITFSHTTALAILRALRAQGALPTDPPPQPFAPLQRDATGRLTIRDIKGTLDATGLEGTRWLSGHKVTDLLYEHGGSRPRTKGVRPHAYGLPHWQGHFVDIPHAGGSLW